MDGFINVLKPPGMTSHDVVAYLRRLLGMRKIGHTGTLDPGVAGVLPICLGKATRLAEYITELPKSYRAEITLGIQTDSQDGYGQVTGTADCSRLGYDDFLRVAAEFTGQQAQLPPMTSAIRVDGKRLYDLARAGLEIQRQTRQITVYRISPLRAEWDGPHPRVIFDVDCSKGTYIRTLCHDIGSRLGVGGMMSFLVRTVSGPFRLAEASTLEEIAAQTAAGDFTFLVPMAAALSYLPRVDIPAELLAAVRHGNPVRLPAGWTEAAANCRALSPAGDLIAIGTVTADPEDGSLVFQPGKVFQEPEAG